MADDISGGSKSRPVAQADRRFAAFISYSHRDEQFGDWLHKRLESYQVPSALVGRETPAGPINKRLGKVFRDRVELSAGHDLGREIREGLEQSNALIVLCSPRSCDSKYVEEEIRTFKLLGKGQRIFAAIIDGEPHAAGRPGYTAADECFPPALIYALGADGTVSTHPEPTEPIAADFREGKDGRESGALKLIAGLLGVGLDELVEREKQAERKRRLRANAIAAGMSVLALFAIVAAAYALVQQDLSNQRRAEVVATQAKDLIARGERSSARLLLDQEKVDGKLSQFGLGRWVLTQSRLPEWGPQQLFSGPAEALLDCDGGTILVQDPGLNVHIQFASSPKPVRFVAEDRALACFRKGADTAIVFDVRGQAYDVSSKGAEILRTPAWMPHLTQRRNASSVIINSQLDGLHSFDLAGRQFMRLGSGGDEQDQRTGVFAGPDPDLFFSIRQSGRGRFFSPEGRSRARAEAHNSAIEQATFVECAQTLDEARMLCVMGDGGLVWLDWSGTLKAVPSPFVGGRAVAVSRLSIEDPLLVVVDQSGDIALIDQEGALASPVLSLGGDAPVAVRLLKSGLIAVAGDTGTICLFQLQAKECLLNDRVQVKNGVIQAAISEDGEIWLRDGADIVHRGDFRSMLSRPNSVMPPETARGKRRNSRYPADAVQHVDLRLPSLTLPASNLSTDGFTFGQPPLIYFVGEDLTWWLQRDESDSVRLISGENSFKLSEQGQFVSAFESERDVWVQLNDRVILFEKTARLDTVLPVRTFDLGKLPGAEFGVAADGETALLRSSEKTVILTKDNGVVLPVRLDYQSEFSLVALDLRRGLLAISNGQCRATLFDLGYAEVLTLKFAPCARADHIEIGADTLEVRAAEQRFSAMLPTVYIDQPR